MFAYVIHARIRSWNQPVLSNEGKGKVSCSRKQQGPLLGLKLTTDNCQMFSIKLLMQYLELYKVGCSCFHVSIKFLPILGREMSVL